MNGDRLPEREERRIRRHVCDSEKMIFEDALREKNCLPDTAMLQVPCVLSAETKRILSTKKF